MTTMRSIGIAAMIAAVAVAAPLAAQAQQANPKWEGGYAGVNAGGLWDTTSANIGYSSGGGSLTGSGGGFVGGVQAGYNWLFGSIVVGPEIDFQGSTLSSYLSGGAGNSSITATETIPWFSTMRMRAGYAVGSVMPYVTGGAVWGHQRLQGTDSANGYFDSSNNFWTYTVGGGVEGRLNDQWSTTAEYLWIGTPNTPLSSPSTTSIDERSIGNLLHVGVNYHFN